MNKVKWSALNCRTDTVQNFKSWLQALHDNIVSAGLVQTSDTGQIDIANISAVPAAEQYAGYLVYRFNDSLSASRPVIVKFRPYCGYYGTTETPFVGNLAVSIGFATDGAGNIVLQQSGEFNYFNNSNYAVRTINAVATPSYAIHSEGRFALCFGVNAYYGTYYYGPALFLDVTRTLDGNGLPSTEGVIVTRNQVPYTGLSDAPGTVIQKGLLNTSMGAWNALLSPWAGGIAAATAGGSVQMQRTYRLTPSLAVDPSLALYWGSSVTTEDEFDLSVDGIQRHYIAIGSHAGMRADASNSGVGFAMLWGSL